jgi:hypothetical protein
VKILSYLAGLCPRSKNLKSCQRTFGTFAFAQHAKANHNAKAKEPNPPLAILMIKGIILFKLAL